MKGDRRLFAVLEPVQSAYESADRVREADAAYHLNQRKYPVISTWMAVPHSGLTVVRDR